MDLTSSKLGRDVKSRSILIAKVMKSIDTIDFELENTEIDVLGDAYEYLIGMYAATAGKKAGEFYTPQSVSKLLSLLATDGLKQTKAVCDCACGSGSLLLQVGRCVKVGHYYGNECNPTTYNLARMNMILHNIHYEQFDIRHTDTIADGGENSSSWEEKYQVQVANPPYSANWSADAKFLEDERFKEMIKDIPQGCLHMPLIDPSANKRSKVTGRTYKQQLQLEHGIVTKEANNSIEDGIQRVKNMMYYGKIRFFNNLTNTLWEGCEYRYPTQEERSKNKNLGDTPLDKDNHLMDCLRYVCQEVPYDYLDVKRASYNNYLRFFDKMKDNKDKKDSNLSFKQLIDIIKTEYEDEQSNINGPGYAGGYTL